MKALENNKKGIIIFSAVLIISFSYLSSYSYAKSNEPKLRTQADVRQYFYTLTDFNDLEKISYSFRQIDVNEDKTPFLHEQIKGRKNAWLIDANDVSLKLKSASPNANDQYHRNFTILIDPNSGTLLKITSKYEGNDPDMKPEPNAISAEKQLRSIREIYLGFPEIPPKISFFDALDVIHKFGVSSPLNAKEIDALYIWHSRRDSEPQRVWVITLRGIPPLPGGTPPWDDSTSPIWTENHIRTVIDAETGEILYENNYPQPIVKEKPN